jgi:hypothetical protein
LLRCLVCLALQTVALSALMQLLLRVKAAASDGHRVMYAAYEALTTTCQARAPTKSRSHARSALCKVAGNVAGRRPCAVSDWSLATAKFFQSRITVLQRETQQRMQRLLPPEPSNTSTYGQSGCRFHLCSVQGKKNAALLWGNAALLLLLELRYLICAALTQQPYRQTERLLTGAVWPAHCAAGPPAY